MARALIKRTISYNEAQTDISDSADTLSSDIGMLDTNTFLETTDFPNPTTLYGWKAGVDGFDTIYGGQDLVEYGTLASAQTRFDGAKDCSFTGSQYLRNTDAAFNFTGDFSITCVAYSSDWAAASGCLVSRSASASNGWYFHINSNHYLGFGTEPAGTFDTSVGVSWLTAGWHTFTVTRDNGTNTAIYIDGLMVARTTTTTAIIAGGSLNIASRRDGSDYFTGYIDEVWIHNGTVLTANEVKYLYARGSLGFYTVDVNNIVQQPSPLDGAWFPYHYFTTLYNYTAGSKSAKYKVTETTCLLKAIWNNFQAGNSGNVAINLPINALHTISSSYLEKGSVFRKGTGLVYNYIAGDNLNIGTCAGGSCANWAAQTGEVLIAEVEYQIV